MLKLLTVFFRLLQRFASIAANQLSLKNKKQNTAHVMPIKYSGFSAMQALVIKRIKTKFSFLSVLLYCKHHCKFYYEKKIG